MFPGNWTAKFLAGITFLQTAINPVRMGYEPFLMDIGMYGNVFSLKYDEYSILATNHTWFKNVWELLQEFKVSAAFDSESQILPVREGDKSLMSEFSKHYSGQDLQALNIYRQFKKVIHVSCITISDGCTIDKECLDAKEGKSVAHKFPLQHPSRALRTLWSNAIMRISSNYLVISDGLGQYIRPPHKPHKWTSNQEGSIAHYQVVRNGIQRYLVYTLSEERETRSG